MKYCDTVDANNASLGCKCSQKCFSPTGCNAIAHTTIVFGGPNTPGRLLMKTSGSENVAAVGGLFNCPDCQHRCSNFAEACPSCGRYFRVYARNYKVEPGNGWSMAVFWGIMLAWIIPTLVCIALLVIFFIIGGIGAATLSRPNNRPNSTWGP